MPDSCRAWPEACRFGRGLVVLSTPPLVPAGPSAGLLLRGDVKPLPLWAVDISADEGAKCCSCRVVLALRCWDVESVCVVEVLSAEEVWPPPDLGGVAVGPLRVERASGCRAGPPPCWRGPWGEVPPLRLTLPSLGVDSAGGVVLSGLECRSLLMPPAGGLPDAVPRGGKFPPRPTIPSLKSSSTYTSTPRLCPVPKALPVLPECRRISRPVPPPGLPTELNPPGLLAPLPVMTPPG